MSFSVKLLGVIGVIFLTPSVEASKRHRDDDDHYYGEETFKGLTVSEGINLETERDDMVPQHPTAKIKEGVERASVNPIFRFSQQRILIPTEIVHKILDLCENNLRLRLVSKGFCSLLNSRIHHFEPIRLDITNILIFTNFVNQLPNLTSLNLYRQIGDKGAKALAQSLSTNTTLISLDLIFNEIRDEEAEALAGSLIVNTSLTSLNLCFNKIGVEGAKALAQSLITNTTLTSLNLGNNKIGDEGTTALAQSLITNSTLTSLYLGNNEIGDEGATALAQGLTTNTTLTSLYLGSNKFEDEGATALAQSLIINNTLTLLNFSFNKIEDKDIYKAIEEILSRNREMKELKL